MLERRLALEAAPEHTPTIGVISTFVVLAWIAVLLRWYTRLVLVKKFYPEDWVMVVTILFFTGYCASAITLSALVTQGTGKVLSITDALKATKLILVVESFYIWSVLILKISIGIFFLRISTTRGLRLSAWICMFLSTVMGIALFLVTILQCGPFTDILVYVTKKLTGQCMSSKDVAAVSYLHGAVTCLTDFIFVIMPIMLLRKASMPTKEKITAGGLLMLASASGIAAIVRFIYIDGIAAPTETFFTTCTGVTVWSCLEPGIGIIASSVICLRPFLRRHLSQLSQISWTFRKKSTYNSSDPYTLELSQDTSALKGTREEVTTDSKDSKTWYDAETEAESSPWPPTVHTVRATDTAKSSENSIEVVLDRADVPVRQSSDGLPLSVYVLERPSAPSASRNSHV